MALCIKNYPIKFLLNLKENFWEVSWYYFRVTKILHWLSLIVKINSSIIASPQERKSTAKKSSDGNGITGEGDAITPSGPPGGAMSSAPSYTQLSNFDVSCRFRNCIPIFTILMLGMCACVHSNENNWLEKWTFLWILAVGHEKAIWTYRYWSVGLSHFPFQSIPNIGFKALSCPLLKSMRGVLPFIPGHSILWFAFK